MQEQLISFETAILAKEKGFPQSLFNTGWYNRFGNLNGRVDINENGEHLYYGLGTYISEPKKKVSKEEFEKYTSVSYQAPTQSSLQKLLREEHNISICIYPVLYEWEVSLHTCHKRKKLPVYLNPENSIHGKTYEEALEKGSQEALKLIKDEADNN